MPSLYLCFAFSISKSSSSSPRSLSQLLSFPHPSHCGDSGHMRYYFVVTLLGRQFILTCLEGCRGFMKCLSIIAIYLCDWKVRYTLTGHELGRGASVGSAPLTCWDKRRRSWRCPLPSPPGITPVCRPCDSSPPVHLPLTHFFICVFQ